MQAPKAFTEDGWLNIGLYGHQPGLAESYINTGSLYLCMNIFLPLGLAADSPFWSDPAEPWTSMKVWNGEDMEVDHALHVN